MLDYFSATKSLSSLANNYRKIEIQQISQIVQLQDELRSICDQSGLTQLQEQIRSSLAISGYDELQKSIAKTIGEIKLPLRSMTLLGTSREFTTTKPYKANISFSAELISTSDMEEKLETEPRRNREMVFTSENATSDKTSAVPVVIDKSVTITLLQKMVQDDFVAGETSSSEEYIEKIASEYGWQNTMRWLNTVYLENYSNPAILVGLMHCLSHFQFDDVKPEGQTMALGVLQHADVFVRDYAIRAYENWNDREALPILKSLACEAKWLQDYIDEVVKVLEE